MHLISAMQANSFVGFFMGLFAADAAAPANADQQSAFMQFLSIVIVLFLCFGLPYLVGIGIARALKLRDLSSKIGWILCALAIALSPFLYQMYNGKSPWSALKLGIDLAGGSNLVYALDRSQKGDEKIDNELMGRMVGAIARRINPDGTKDVVVRQVGSDRIEVIIPGADKQTVDDFKNKITNLGSLEFAILATPRKHKPIIDKALALGPKQRNVFGGGKLVAKWRPIMPIMVDGKETPNTDFDNDPNVITRQNADKPAGFMELLVMVDTDPDKQVTGRYLSKAYSEYDENGSPAVGFLFNRQGAARFRRLTREHKPLEDGFEYRLGILLDEQVKSAPSINQEIGARGIIKGNFTAREVNDLVAVLNAGALPVPLEKSPIQEYTIGALLGESTVQQGKYAITIASLAVVIFMLLYYGRFAGTIADVGLLLNIVFVLGFMAFIKASFTLPGLAGLVLTIGMAVDANVLIFERIREEMTRGSSLRMSIHNGFSRALTTIVDANVTTLITAVILFYIGTDQVKGFAVMLFIGITMSMFTSLYIGRLFFDILERKRWMKELKMRSIVGATSWNFIGKQGIAAVASLVLIVAGMVAFFGRGEDNYDIDFSGGTMISFSFTSPHEFEEVNEKLKKTFADKYKTGISLESLGIDKGLQYRLRTTASNAEDVTEQDIENAINETFPDQLIKITMSYGPIETMPATKAAAVEPEKPAEGEEATNPEATADEPERHVVDLNFSGATSFDTVKRKLGDELAKVKEGEGEKYTDTDSLFEFQGLAGPGMKAEDNEIKTYTEMKLIANDALSVDDLKTSLAAMQTEMANNPIFTGVQRFEGQVASEAKWNALYAMVASLAAIIAYIWLRFQRITFGFAAVAALVHDVLCVVGLVALASYVGGTTVGEMLQLVDFKINLPMIAAFLTIVGYSLNDTIVVFDRIREVRGKNPSLDTAMVNTSLNQTLSRTLLTSLTTLIVVIILYFLGGEGIHGFAFCLVAGVFVGTYSSIYVASPVLLFLMNWSKKREATT